MKILAIETTCDDTSIAVMENYNTIAMNTHSQTLEHSKLGGVMPELASRLHSSIINKLISQTLDEANIDIRQINAIAIAQGPGLANSLHVGLVTAKTLSATLNIPLYGIDHIEAHAWSHFINKNSIHKEALILIVSGGHTQIIEMNELFVYKILGQSRDDAIGEAFDKVARILGLGYPGGPIIDRTYRFSKDKIHNIGVPKVPGLDMSFSGLKSKVHKLEKDKTINNISIAKGFQVSAITHVIDKLKVALATKKYKHLFVGGGVAANSLLREELEKFKIDLHLPKKIYTSDNAAMIGYLCWLKLKYKKIIPISLDAEAKPRLEIK